MLTYMFTGVVLSTALELFRAKKIQHAVFEYSASKEFQSRNGTDLDTFLPTLFELGATKCFALHRRKPLIFQILRRDAALFKQTMTATQEQTDVYCAFVPVTFSAPLWTPTTILTDGKVNEFIFGPASRETARVRAKRDPRFARRDTYSSACAAAPPPPPSPVHTQHSSNSSSPDNQFKNLNTDVNKNAALLYKID